MAKQKSDLSRAFSEDGALKTHVGGQALLEGVMMRGKYNWSVAVREPEGGIYTEEHDLASGRKKNGWLYWPVIRGCRAFVESLVLGYKALSIAVEHAFVEEDEGGESGAGTTKSPAGIEQSETPVVMPAGSDACASGDRGAAANASSTAYAGDSPAEGSAAGGDAHENGGGFSWKNDFGNPSEIIDALGAQRTLDVVRESEDAVATRMTSGSGSAFDADDSSCAIAQMKESSTSPHCDSGGSSKAEPALSNGEMTLSLVLGVVLGVVLFVVAPAAVTNLIVGEYDSNTLLWNIVDGVLRVAIFIFYIWLIGRMEDINRMYGYHGAEHKTIHCYEHGLPLTPENARQFPRLHVRCGTAFLIMVMIIAILVYTITPLNGLIAAWGVPDGAPKLLLVIFARILLMPIIAGVSYEITVKWAGSHPENPVVKVVLWPGLQMQYLTTREPGDGELECAIEAMKLVLRREEAEAAGESAGVAVDSGEMHADGASIGCPTAIDSDAAIRPVGRGE